MMEIDLDGIIDGAIDEHSSEIADAVEEVVEEVVEVDVEEAQEDDAADPPQDIKDDAEEVQEEPSEDIAPLENWSKEDQEKFNALSSEGKEFVMNARKDLERGYNRKFEDLADIRKEHEAFNNVFAPVKSQIDALGMKPVQVIQNLVNAEQSLRSNPAQGIRDVITQYGGANAKEIVHGMAQELGLLSSDTVDGESEYVDPQVKALQDQVAALKGGLEQTAQNEQQKTYQQHLNTVNLFKDAVDDAGNKLHPHFDKVEQSMADIISAARSRGQTINIDDAYTSAVRMDPELFQQMIDEEKAKVAKQQDVKRKARVAASKKAATSPKESIRKAPEGGGKQTLDEILNAAIG